MINPGNKGEWAEIYIFLKLVSEGKVYMADKNMQRLAATYMKIIKIFREEVPGEKLEYVIDNPIHIIRDNENIGPDTPTSTFEEYTKRTWTLIDSASSGNGLFDFSIAKFLEGIHINKLKAPAQSSADYFGGTEDIIMQLEDYRSGIDSIMGFSCKSQFTAESTLFNASGNNTNFRYKITGDVNDLIMDTFNGTFNTVNKKNKKTGIVEPKNEVAIADRMRYLKESGCDLQFVNPCGETAKRNLIQSGGMEMPAIIGEMLKYYYFRNNGETEYSNVTKVIRYLANTDPVKYDVDDLYGMYRSKIGKLLYDMFTGMRMGSVWTGRQTVTGGYICAKNDGDVVAYHANVADEFKDFLVNQLAFETPSATRHNYMKIEKSNGEYFINLNMQFRFAKSEMVKLDILEKKLKKQREKISNMLDKLEKMLSNPRPVSNRNSNEPNRVNAKIESIKSELSEMNKQILSIEQKKKNIHIGSEDY